MRVLDEETGWLNKSALKVVKVNVKGAGTNEDTWYEDNKGQVSLWLVRAWSNSIYIVRAW